MDARTTLTIILVIVFIAFTIAVGPLAGWPIRPIGRVNMRGTCATIR